MNLSGGARRFVTLQPETYVVSNLQNCRRQRVSDTHRSAGNIAAGLQLRVFGIAIKHHPLEVKLDGHMGYTLIK